MMNEEIIVRNLETFKLFAKRENEAARRSWGLTMSAEHEQKCINKSKAAHDKNVVLINQIELTPHAKKVLAYLEKDLTHKEIAALMGCTRQAVGDTMRRYGLQRRQLSKGRAKDGQFSK